MIEAKIVLLKQFFETMAVSWQNRKSIQELQGIIKSDNRETRHIIEILRSEYNMMITADLENGGYFLADKNNLFDIAVSKRFIESQKSRADKIWLSIRPFKKMFPEGQCEFDFEKEKII